MMGAARPEIMGREGSLHCQDKYISIKGLHAWHFYVTQDGMVLCR